MIRFIGLYFTAEFIGCFPRLPRLGRSSEIDVRPQAFFTKKTSPCDILRYGFGVLDTYF